VLFILIGAAFRISVDETFLLIPIIVNAGLLLSIQDFPRILWRGGRAVADEERQETPSLSHVATNRPAEDQPFVMSSLASNGPVEDRIGH
jgi:hypothetical protein